VVAVVVIVVALTFLARSWPRSSRDVGFRLWTRRQEDWQDPVIREDEDAHWDWPAGPGEESDPGGGPGGSASSLMG
jgi:hypothetical protein